MRQVSLLTATVILLRENRLAIDSSTSQGVTITNVDFAVPATKDSTLQTRIQDRTLALAAVAQAAALVDQLANTGDVPHEPYQTSIASLFSFQPESAEAIYGGDPDYRQRLALGFTTLKDILGKHESERAAEIARCAFGMLHMSGKLRTKKAMLDLIGQRLGELQEDPHCAFDPVGETVVSGLARCYGETLGAFRFRVYVQAGSRYRQDPVIAERGRALLLAGVRAAILWRQRGGRYWQLLFHRRDILRALADIA